MSEPQPIATVIDVQEASLLADADVAPWASLLADEGLVPHAPDGRARLMISSPNLRWMGIRFSELIVAIECGRRESSEAEGAFLAAAFSTNRMLAWMERAFFRTGYRPARIGSRADPSPGFTLSEWSRGAGDPPALQAERAQDDRPRRVIDDRWSKSVFLPAGRQFHVTIAGATEVCAFDQDRDIWRIEPSPRLPILQRLADSGCRPTEWRVRASALHARSKTVRRSH
ncbi:MAG: hypothetical protein KF774_08855 [Planctomyces sp.]|nr:hypothetical protein [Planctomyces sp.]